MFCPSFRVFSLVILHPASRWNDAGAKHSERGKRDQAGGITATSAIRARSKLRIATGPYIWVRSTRLLHQPDWRRGKRLYWCPTATAVVPKAQVWLAQPPISAIWRTEGWVACPNQFGAGVARWVVPIRRHDRLASVSGPNPYDANVPWRTRPISICCPFIWFAAGASANARWGNLTRVYPYVFCRHGIYALCCQSTKRGNLQSAVTQSFRHWHREHRAGAISG